MRSDVLMLVALFSYTISVFHDTSLVWNTGGVGCWDGVSDTVEDDIRSVDDVWVKSVDEWGVTVDWGGCVKADTGCFCVDADDVSNTGTVSGVNAKVEDNLKAVDDGDGKADCGDAIKADGDDDCTMLEYGCGIKPAGMGGAEFVDGAEETGAWCVSPRVLVPMDIMARIASS